MAARTWADSAANRRDWDVTLRAAVQTAARQALDALGGFDDPATLLSAGRAGLLRLVESRPGGAA